MEFIRDRSLKMDCGGPSAEVLVFPNPAKSQVNVVYLAEEEGQILELDVVDLAGRKIAGKGVELKAGNNVINLDISSIATGQYFYAIVWLKPERRVR
ncbi:MAG: T9SS type A sorting domain-containing protein [Bacteroidota bacterium]|nr:MAG: T9SS type A sorting domain-containing protein [Bacteroidota bacterium]